MIPASSKQEFEQFLKQSGDISLSLHDGIHGMLDFYNNARANGCDMDSDGDMLLFQWGTYDWGDGEFFSINITRQFMVADGEDDDAISQLSLTFEYLPTEQYQELESGNRWCNSVDSLTEFTSYIVENSAYRALENDPPNRILLEYDPV